MNNYAASELTLMRGKMEIRINDCSVDFELDEERTIKDIINFITVWTQHRGLIFTEVRIDDKSYPIDQVPDTAIDEVNILNCQVQSKADIVISSIDAGIDYCTRIENFFYESGAAEKINNEEIENITAGIDWLIEVLRKISDLLTIDINSYKYKDKSISFYIDKVIELKKNIHNENDKNELIAYINKEKGMFSLISGILKMFMMSENMKSLVIQSIDSPDVLVKSLFDIKAEIPAQIKNLEEIAISYQTGKDGIASQKLEDFINFIFRYSRTCYQITPVFEVDLANIKIDDSSLEKKNSDIQNLLYEIIDVMENNDFISLSDILEYEMKSSLENMELYIDALIDFLGKKSSLHLTP